MYRNASLDGLERVPRVRRQRVVPLDACRQPADHRQPGRVGREGQLGPERGIHRYRYRPGTRLPHVAGLRMNRHQHQVSGRLPELRSRQVQPLRAFPGGQQRAECPAEELPDRSREAEGDRHTAS
ncbi:hypothetical protein [Streptomyces sp. NPDC127084]|uniref:hypothetical protein n=1 Tax=Streptomyces sp. NPDC127084 TaxID=3347133 RepID=UPI00364E5830